MTFGVARIGMCGRGGAGRDEPVPYGATSFVPGAGRDKPVPYGAVFRAPGAGRDKPVPYEFSHVRAAVYERR